MPKAEVTGGDLHVLWKVTHTALPQIENVYNEVTKIHAETLDGGDTDTFGRAYPTWQLLQKAAHDILYQTAVSVATSRMTLNMAIREYTFVDADNSEELTKAGEGLKADLEDPNTTKDWMNVEIKGEPHKPKEDDD